MSDVTLVVKVKLRLPTVDSFEEAEIRGAEILEELLMSRLAVREVEVMKVQEVRKG